MFFRALVLCQVVKWMEYFLTKILWIKMRQSINNQIFCGVHHHVHQWCYLVATSASTKPNSESTKDSTAQPWAIDISLLLITKCSAYSTSHFTFHKDNTCHKNNQVIFAKLKKEIAQVMCNGMMALHDRSHRVSWYHHTNDVNYVIYVSYVMTQFASFVWMTSYNPWHHFPFPSHWSQWSIARLDLALILFQMLPCGLFLEQLCPIVRWGYSKWIHTNF